MTNKELREKVAKWYVNQIGYYWGGDLCDQERLEYMEKAANFLSLVAEALPKCIKKDPMIDSQTTKRIAWLNCGRKEYQREVQKLLKGE